MFGVVDRAKKDASGSAALDEGNIVCDLLRRAKAAGLAMAGITDLCFCEYTSHGHCGPLTPDGNPPCRMIKTVELLIQQAVNHASGRGAGGAAQRP